MYTHIYYIYLIWKDPELLDIDSESSLLSKCSNAQAALSLQLLNNKTIFN